MWMQFLDTAIWVKEGNQPVKTPYSIKNSFQTRPLNFLIHKREVIIKEPTQPGPNSCWQQETLDTQEAIHSKTLHLFFLLQVALKVLNTVITACFCFEKWVEIVQGKMHVDVRRNCYTNIKWHRLKVVCMAFCKRNGVIGLLCVRETALFLLWRLVCAAVAVLIKLVKFPERKLICSCSCLDQNSFKMFLKIYEQELAAGSESWWGFSCHLVWTLMRC